MKTQNPTVLRYVPSGLYTVGVCHYGLLTPYKQVEVEADSLPQAMEKARCILAPSQVEHIKHVQTRPNPAFKVEQDRWLAARFGTKGGSV